MHLETTNIRRDGVKDQIAGSGRELDEITHI